MWRFRRSDLWLVRVRSLFDAGNRRSGFVGGVGRSLFDGEIGDRVSSDIKFVYNRARYIIPKALSRRSHNLDEEAKTNGTSFNINKIIKFI